MSKKVVLFFLLDSSVCCLLNAGGTSRFSFVIDFKFF